MIIDLWGSKGDAVECRRIISLMKDYGSLPNSDSYLPLLRIFVDLDLAQTKSILVEMNELRITSDIKVYNLLIDAWVKKGALVEANRLVQQMEKAKVLPNDWTFSSLVRGNILNNYSIDSVEKYATKLQRAFRRRRKWRLSKIDKLNEERRSYENDFSFPEPLNEDEFEF